MTPLVRIHEMLNQAEPFKTAKQNIGLSESRVGIKL